MRKITLNMAKQKVYVLSSSDWAKGSRKRVYDTFEEARAVMDKEVKSHLKKLPGWEVDYHKIDCARIHLLTYSFDKNDTWKIEEAEMFCKKQ